MRLLREVAGLKSSSSSRPATGLVTGEVVDGGYYYTSQPNQTEAAGGVHSTPASGLIPKMTAKQAISSVGALRLYEFLLGIFFIAAMMNWTVTSN